MSAIVQNSLIMFGLLVTAVLFIQLMIYLIAGKGIVLTFSLLILGIVVIDCELAYILGQIELNFLNVILIFGPGILLTLGVIYILFRIVVVPVRMLTVITKRLADGDLQGGLSYSKNNEIGQLAAGLINVIAYQREMICLANQIARGELGETVRVKSAQDELGQAFHEMSAQLNNAIQQVSRNAYNLREASQQLASASEQSGDATRQIATTIQQVAQGITQQTASVTKTSTSVEQMERAIDSVERGAQEQAKAISTASLITARINDSIQQVAKNIQTVTRDSAQSAEYSRNGAQTVNETISGMEVIRRTVDVSALKVKEMGTRSEEIGNIVDTIEDIASQTNLLAFNAAIEAARASGMTAKVTEQLLQRHLLGIAALLAELCACNGKALTMQDLVSLAARARVDTLNIIDEDGVVTMSNVPESIGFRLPEDTKEQAAAFRPLIKQKDGALAQPAQPRSQDGVLYIYVGVSRRDQPGVIQAGAAASVIEKSGDATRGFAVVADEVRKLAERSSGSTKEIASLIKNIQKTISQAVEAMNTSALEVESGVIRANSAGEVLGNILKAAESVHKQAEEAGNAAAKVSAAATELVESVDAVSAVIKQNTAAMEQMAGNSSELTQSIENIASVSEENSASVEEVSASTEQVSAQAEEVSASAASLMEMAQQLSQVVKQFKLAEDSKDSTFIV